MIAGALVPAVGRHRRGPRLLGARRRSQTASSATTTSRSRSRRRARCWRTHFINYILDNEVSEKNFGWNGYQPPLTKLGRRLPDRSRATSHDNLLSAVVVPDDFDEGIQVLRDRRSQSRTCGCRHSRSSRVAEAETPVRAGSARPSHSVPLALSRDPGHAWLILLFVVPFYGIMAVAFSTEFNISRSADSGVEPVRLELHRLQRRRSSSPSPGSTRRRGFTRSCTPHSRCRSALWSATRSLTTWRGWPGATAACCWR